MVQRIKAKKILYKRHTDLAESFNQKPKGYAPGRHNRLFDGVGRSQEGFMNAATGGPNSNQNSINQLRSENHRAKQEVHIKASPSYALSKKELDLKGSGLFG